jgi:hypothetical protein
VSEAKMAVPFVGSSPVPLVLRWWVPEPFFCGGASHYYKFRGLAR